MSTNEAFAKGLEEGNIHIINYCPVCSINNVSLIPLANDDVYNMNLRSKGGLELRFSKANKL
jgi:hypothetical protein